MSSSWLTLTNNISSTLPDGSIAPYTLLPGSGATSTGDDPATVLAAQAKAVFPPYSWTFGQALSQLVAHVRDDIVVGRELLHRLAVAAPMHRDVLDAGLRDHAVHLGIGAPAVTDATESNAK